MVGTNCYLVYDNETKRAAVIDPGDSADKIANMAASLELKPEAILLTHGHFDHMMAAKDLKEAWNARSTPVRRKLKCSQTAERVLSQIITENRIH